MSDDRGGTNELRDAAIALAGLAAWGLTCGMGWHGLVALCGELRYLNDGIWVSFYAASMVSAVAAARWAPRVAGSLRLLALALIAGLATAFLVGVERARNETGAFVAMLVMLAAPLMSLRLVLDLLMRRGSPRARRAAAFVGAPLAFLGMLVAMRTAQGGHFSLGPHDRVIVGAIAALGLAVVPPRRFEAPAAD